MLWWTNGWGVFFGGVGIVFGCISLGIGLDDRGVWVWPILLGIVGLSILRGALLQRR